jgi:GNAT superfamily N-acetyltransferase
LAVGIQQVGSHELGRYARIPIVFTVESVFRVEPEHGGLGGLILREERLDVPCVKDYDAQDEESPARWGARFDVSKWGIFLAAEGECDVGGAVVAFDAPGVHMLEQRKDLAVLWDIRVHPDARRRGVGSALFEHAAGWARDRGCRLLKIETQNINVPACRFYASRGCTLGAISRYGYTGCPDIAHETMLLWYLEL